MILRWVLFWTTTAAVLVGIIGTAPAFPERVQNVAAGLLLAGTGAWVVAALLLVAG